METTTEVDYYNLLNMLKSDDDENKVLALNILENVPFEENFIKMVLLKKEANIDFDFWQVHAPESAKKLRKIFNGIQASISLPITQHTILLLVHSGIKATEDEVKLFLEESFKAYLKDKGFSEKYYVDFTIKSHTDE